MTEASERKDAAHAQGFSQREHILDVALSLMAQRGVDGTSMRDLARATGLNVASIYHYFPSKRDLLVSVLEGRGFTTNLTATWPPTLFSNATDPLINLLDDILRSMLEVEEFVHLMLGEVLRGDDTAHAVGLELFNATEESLRRWLEEFEPALCAGPGAPAIARMLRSIIVGLFFEHVAGGLLDGDDTAAAFHQRAVEMAAVLRNRN